MTYNLERKIKFTITRYIENVYTWEKNRNTKKKERKKRIKSAVNDKKILKKLKAIISKYSAIFLHYNTQQLFLYKRTVKPFTR